MKREMTILVVDDESTNLDILNKILTGGDYRVSLTTSGELALQYIQSHRVALVLLDIKMPVLDGFEVCRRLKANPDSADIPIIFISALHDIEDKVEAFNVGGVDYIMKPFQQAEVLARVRAHLELSYTRRSLKEARDLLEERVHERTRELTRSESRFRSIFQGVPDAMVLANTNREIVMINSAFSKILGYSLNELEGQQTVFFYESQEEFERQGKLRFNLSAEEKHKPYVVNYKRKNGEVFPGETIRTAIKDDEGSTISFLGVIRDITERRQAEQALRESNIALKVLVDQQQSTKEEVEQQVLTKLKKLVFPYLDLLQGSAKNPQEQESFAIIREHLSSITDSFTRKLSGPLLNLSQREILVADLVRQGKSTQEMADLLGLSLRTIEAYRMQLRKKLGLKTKKENLRKYLLDNFVKE